MSNVETDLHEATQRIKAVIAAEQQHLQQSHMDKVITWGGWWFGFGEPEHAGDDAGNGHIIMYDSPDPELANTPLPELSQSIRDIYKI